MAELIKNKINNMLPISATLALKTHIDSEYVNERIFQVNGNQEK